MATPTVTHHRHQRWSPNELSTELIVLILRQLGDVDSRSLSVARLVSARFNAIVTPMKYHTLRVTQNIIMPQADIRFPEGIANICAHTRHVRVDSDLNAEHVKRLLDKIERLSSLRYLLSFLICAFRRQHAKGNPETVGVTCKMICVKLYIENLPLQDFRSERHNPYLRAIPTEILVSLMMATPAPPLTARVESLKDLLLSSRRLETFWYDDRGQGTRFEFSDNERLPAFKELSLRSYDWNHSSAAVGRHWDFSEIRCLSMVDVPLGLFLSSISFADFRRLETLRLVDFNTHLPDRRLDITRSQYFLIKQIQGLIDLDIICQTESFPIDGILKHGHSLRVLRFRDYTGFGDEHRRCPTIKLEALDVMARELVNIRTLELDMDEGCCESHYFLLALCNFHQLNTLTLHTQTSLNPAMDMDTSVDHDRKRAMEIFSLLIQGKQAALWRSITINVGGWKPIMARRFSAPWRELHTRGVYAERCFIMEKQENGMFAVREEFPIRAS
ncbi:hypothetical protein NUW58_g1750 [Xylaria curta]|uniref:Uncharacterized protein n=1 Tax=Xylaria curta TaxID=42375 RepID=A0ACC1PKE6_9PEZI|nr:hypothetical protein NUW58_g1750 [Xylaria curta]